MGTSAGNSHRCFVPGSVTAGLAAGIYIYVIDTVNGEKTERIRTGVLYVVK
ncbi:MAG: hypothetical protein LLG37_02010 [Spirochaetia bacterium]|nr:hypothetical protein [Spirochaetia bacterium]